jgi:DNA-binding winged helix-turn-helix (wHTH) protein
MNSMSTQLLPMHSPEEHESSHKAAVAPSRYVCFGAFHLDLKKEELFKDGTRVKLQGKVYQALLALLQKPGEIVTREALRLQLWPSDTHVNYDANVNTTVNKLRQVLGDSPVQPAFVDTIPRKGYSFVAKVEYVEQPVILQSLQGTQPAERSLLAAIAEHAEGKASFFRTVILSRWFTAGVVTLVIASMLFGAALMLYAHR